MKELKIDAEPSYEYTMLSSPKRNLSNLPMNAIVATIFFGCGMILGWVSSGIDQTPVDFTGARAHFRYGLDRSDTLGNNDAMPKLAWLVRDIILQEHTSLMMTRSTEHSFLVFAALLSKQRYELHG
jgi:hypothetical protein